MHGIFHHSFGCLGCRTERKIGCECMQVWGWKAVNLANAGACPCLGYLFREHMINFG